MSLLHAHSKRMAGNVLFVPPWIICKCASPTLRAGCQRGREIVEAISWREGVCKYWLCERKQLGKLGRALFSPRVGGGSDRSGMLGWQGKLILSSVCCLPFLLVYLFYLLTDLRWFQVKLQVGKWSHLSPEVTPQEMQQRRSFGGLSGFYGSWFMVFIWAYRWRKKIFIYINIADN